MSHHYLTSIPIQTRSSQLNSNSNSISSSSLSNGDKESLQVHISSTLEKNSEDNDNLSDRSAHPISNEIGLSDDDGVYPDNQTKYPNYNINYNNNYNDDDDDQYSLASILSDHNEQIPKTQHPEYKNEKTSKARNPSSNEQSKNKEGKSNQPKQKNKVSQEKKIIQPSNKNEHLEDLAEQTYFNFISDLSIASKSRTLNSSLEQLAMQRVISDQIYAYFTQPNFVKLVRHEMIEAAQNVLDSIE